MTINLIDANVIIRFLTDRPETVHEKFRGTFSFFKKLENDEVQVYLSDLVLFEVYFVLTSFYKTPEVEAAQSLFNLIQYPGIRMDDKARITQCLELLKMRKIGIVDAWIVVKSNERHAEGVYSFDRGFEKFNLPLIPIE